MGRTVVILLALSLAANVFLGGFVAGRVAGPNLPGFGHDGATPGGEPRDGHGDRRAEFDALPPAVREKLKEAFRKNRVEFVETFREGRALHEDFVSILTADAFDRAAAEAAAAKIEAFEGERRRSMPRLVIDAMEGLSVEDRRALAAVVERRFIEDMGGHGDGRQRRRHRRRGHDGGDPPELAPDSTPTD